MCSARSARSHVGHSARSSQLDGVVSAREIQADNVCEASMPSVLIAVDVDLGLGKESAMLRVAPWHTAGDFDAVVKAFLEEHRVRPVFASALVQYLEDVEKQSATFPVSVRASIADIYSKYG